MKQESQLVVAIKNGTVIDHIPSAKLFEVVNLLHLQDVRDSAIIVGYNLKSKKFGHKSLIKVFDKFFTDAELNQLSVVAPNVTLCIIRDYEVVEKKSVTLPEELRGIVRCNNPKCITNNEPMQTVFHVSDRENGLLRCHYCGTLIDGTKFDSSYDRNQPAVFGLNQVIAGWTEGLQLMSEGSKYELYIPYQLAYGTQGAPGAIPPYAALIFTVELLEVL